MIGQERISGIADECAPDLQTQIEAHLELGWREIELRTIGGTPLEDLNQAQVIDVSRRLTEVGLKVTALASRIGGWQRSVYTPFEWDEHDLLTLASHADELDCRLVRIMSFPNADLPEDMWRSISLSRIGRLVRLAERLDLVLLHENCVGWASQGPEQTIGMMREHGCDALRLLFDLGNPVYYGQDGLAYLRAVITWVEHVHVKDAIRNANDEVLFTWPGEGQADLTTGVAILRAAGYGGAWSIEPHIDMIPHSAESSHRVDTRERYVRYGTSLARLLALAVPESNG